MINSKSIIEATYSFEQKGTTELTLGEGFHVHIIANCKYTSSYEVTKRVNQMLESQDIKAICSVNNLRKTSDIKQTINYITNYESNDGHKIATKEGDIAWRTTAGLETIYRKLPVSLGGLIKVEPPEEG